MYSLTCCSSRSSGTPVPQHDVVEVAHVESRPHLLLRLLPQLGELQLTDFVGQRLAGPRDVAIDLRERLRRHVGLEVRTRAFPRPAHRVHAGVHDQSHGAELLVGQLAEPAGRIAIDGAEFMAERLRIERPPLCEGGRREHAPELRQVLRLARDGRLQVVAGQRLVEHQRLDVVPELGLGSVGVHVEPRRTAAIRGSRFVVRGRGRFAIGRDGPDVHRHLREPPEQPRHRRLHAREDLARVVDHLLLAGEAHAWTIAELRFVLRDRARGAVRPRHLLHLPLDARHLAQAEAMHLFSVHPGRSVKAHRTVVQRAPSGHGRHRDVSAGTRPVGSAQERFQAFPARHELRVIGGCGRRQQALLISGRHLRREATEGRQQWSGGSRHLRLGRHLLEHQIHDDSRLGGPRVDVLAHERQVLIDIHGNGVQAGDDVLVVAHRARRHLVDRAEHVGVQTALLRHSPDELAVPLHLQCVPQLPLEDVCAQPVRRREVAGIDVIDGLEKLPAPFACAIAAALRQVAPPVVELRAADPGGQLGLGRQPPFPVGAEERVQRLLRGPDAARRKPFLLNLSRGKRGRNPQCHGERKDREETTDSHVQGHDSAFGSLIPDPRSLYNSPRRRYS